MNSILIERRGKDGTVKPTNDTQTALVTRLMIDGCGIMPALGTLYIHAPALGKYACIAGIAKTAVATTISSYQYFSEREKQSRQKIQYPQTG